MTPDQINAFFEFVGAMFICLSIRRLYIDKKVRGVSVIPITFFAFWGWWNLYFYPVNELWWSFTAGLFMVAANTVWLGQMGYYVGYEILTGDEL